MNTSRYAKDYANKGLSVVPILANQKKPVMHNWSALRIGPEDIPQYFNGKPQNIGILLGEPSGGLVDVDLDVEEAVKVAEHFLRPTLTSGREKTPHTHWWFRAPGAETEKWKDTDGETLMELRSTGCQTVVEPSVHPEGDRYLWHRGSGSSIADTSAEDLSRACQELATAVLIARHLPPVGGRHEFAMALAGYLLRPGRLDEKTVLKVMLAAWHAGGGDSRDAVTDVERIVRDTARNLEVDHPVYGGPTLAETAPGVPETLARWWGWDRATTGSGGIGFAPNGHRAHDRTTPTTPSTPIIEELPKAPTFPVDALPVGTRRFVKEAAKAIGCPPELVAVPLLGTLSAGIGASRVVQLKQGWQESATLFLATVAPPGSKKTPAARVATRPVWYRQAELKKEYREEREVYKAECRQWEAHKRQSQKGEPLPEPPGEPTMKRTVVEDTTVEALQSVLATNPRGVLVTRDELAGWARSMDQYKSGKGADRQFWLGVWGNQSVAVDRKGDAEPTILEKPWLSVVGSIQPNVLPDLASGREDGLLDRFLFAYPEPQRTRLSDDHISPEASGEVERLYGKLASLEMREDEDGEAIPGVIPLSLDAWEVFKEVANDLQDEMHAPGFPIRLQGVWSKMEAYLARLALILASCRVADKGGDEQVEVSDVLLASGLLEYFKAHARRVHAGLHGHNGEDLLARELAQFLREHDDEWKGEPNVLHEELKKRKSEAVSERPDELSKMVYAIAGRGTWLKAEPGWTKNEEGKSRRAIRLRLKTV
jgi:Protein of unknown function (DUF3987)/Bifunctional DNA primase/polymerase, N-terminal